MKPDVSALDLPSFENRQSLRTQITRALRAALVAGEMGPGVVYSAPVLAERFGVSATPVREAMLDLTKEGLVEPVPNKGFRVTALSETDLDEIAELRALIEVPTVGKLAVLAGAADFERMRPLARSIEDAAAAGDLIAYVEADRRFHLELLALAGNRRLVETVGELRARSRLYGLRELAERGELSASAGEHAKLLDLLARRDASGAERLMVGHIGHIRGVWAGRPE